MRKTAFSILAGTMAVGISTSVAFASPQKATTTDEETTAVVGDGNGDDGDGNSTLFEQAVNQVMGEQSTNSRLARTATSDAHPISGDALEAALIANGAEQVNVTSGDELEEPEEWEDDPLERRGGLPTDTFKVRSQWADYVDNGKRFIAFYGRWNYDNAKIGSGAPDDLAAMKVAGFPVRCWTNVSTGLKTQDSDGVITNLRARYDSAHQETIWKVFDDTSAFKLQTDMGFGWIEMRRDALGCDARKTGRFWHEHNQNGGGGWTAGIDLWIFNVSYTNEGKSLRKATKIKYLDYSE